MVDAGYRFFPAHLRKPASDIYLRDYLIGGGGPSKTFSMYVFKNVYSVANRMRYSILFAIVLVTFSFLFGTKFIEESHIPRWGNQSGYSGNFGSYAPKASFAQGQQRLYAQKKEKKKSTHPFVRRYREEKFKELGRQLGESNLPPGFIIFVLVMCVFGFILNGEKSP